MDLDLQKKVLLERETYLYLILSGADVAEDQGKANLHSRERLTHPYFYYYSYPFTATFPVPTESNVFPVAQF